MIDGTLSDQEDLSNALNVLDNKISTKEDLLNLGDYLEFKSGRVLDIQIRETKRKMLSYDDDWVIENWLRIAQDIATHYQSFGGSYIYGYNPETNTFTYKTNHRFWNGGTYFGYEDLSMSEAKSMITYYTGSSVPAYNAWNKIRSRINFPLLAYGSVPDNLGSIHSLFNYNASVEVCSIIGGDGTIVDILDFINFTPVKVFMNTIHLLQGKTFSTERNNSDKLEFISFNMENNTTANLGNQPNIQKDAIRYTMSFSISSTMAIAPKLILHPSIYSKISASGEWSDLYEYNQSRTTPINIVSA